MSVYREKGIEGVIYRARRRYCANAAAPRGATIIISNFQLCKNTESSSTQDNNIGLSLGILGGNVNFISRVTYSII